MVQQQTVMNVADNTGAKKIMVIRVLGGSRRRFGRKTPMELSYMQVEKL